MLCKNIYNTGNWPTDFTKTMLIPLPKKTNAVECSDHRTISLISHASKIILKILTNRITAKAEEYIGDNQFGFRKGCGTRDAIGVMRMIMERNLEVNKEVYICFVDFEKAFDRVNWVKMMTILKHIGIDIRDRRLIWNLYSKQSAVIKVGDELSDDCQIGRGVRQGCCLSPILFSIYAEAMMKEAMENIRDGVKIGGKIITDVRFADDQAMVSNTEQGLQKIVQQLDETAEKYDMKINIRKTKVMKVTRNKNRLNNKITIKIKGQELEQVQKFKYLGSLLNEDNRSIEDIKMRIAIAKEAFNKRKELMTKNFNKDLKKRIIKTIVWSTMLYSSETWTLTKEAIRRIEAFEMWIWRRVEKISYTDRKTNKEVLDRVGEQRSLLKTLVNRKKKWIGHIIRGENIMKIVIEGKIEGKKGRGRPRLGMLNELIENKYVNTKIKAMNRKEWRCWMPKTCYSAEH